MVRQPVKYRLCHFLMKSVKAIHADSWYPLDPKLTRIIEEAFRQANFTIEADRVVKAVITPHAGYAYSLPTAAYSYKAINPDLYDRVVVFGPSHRFYLDNCAIYDAEEVETPLGSISTDIQTIKMLTKDHPKMFSILDTTRVRSEHSLELQYPLIRYIFGRRDIKILPIIVGSIPKNKFSEYASVLNPIINEPRTLLIMSSDFCHWGKDFDYQYLPDCQGEIYERIEKLDHDGMEAIKSGAEALNDYFSKTKNTICGKNPIKLGILSLNPGYRVSWLNYRQSDQVMNKDQRSVSYASGVFTM